MACASLRNFQLGISLYNVDVTFTLADIIRNTYIHYYRVLSNVINLDIGTDPSPGDLHLRENDNEVSISDGIPITNVEETQTSAFIKKGTMDNSTESKRKKTKPNFAGEVLAALKKSRLERDEIMSQIKSAPAEDDTDTFFHSLAKTVKTFPPLMKAQIKRKLFEVVSDAEIELLRRSLPSTQVTYN